VALFTVPQVGTRIENGLPLATHVAVGMCRWQGHAAYYAGVDAGARSEGARQLVAPALTSWAVCLGMCASSICCHASTGTST
jgi:hypothetical protein